MINKKTLSVPKYFYKLPKDVQILVFEMNYEHYPQLQLVLVQLVKYIHCSNCRGLILPSLINKVTCCSSECMYELMDIFNQS